MEKSLNRTITEESFEYGNHIITITVSVKNDHISGESKDKKEYIHSVHSYQGLYCREVTCVATPKDEESDPDIEETTKYALGKEEQSIKLPFIPADIILRYKEITLQEQMKQTCRSVLEELDTIYEFTMNNVSVDVDVTMDELEAETSWVDIENEIENKVEKISSEVAQ